MEYVLVYQYHYELFSSPFTIICHLSCRRSGRNICLSPIASQADRHRTEEGLNVPQLDPWPCLVVYRRQDFTVIYFTDMFRRNILLQQQAAQHTRSAGRSLGTLTGDCTTRTCVSCSILSQIMRNCKYSKYTKISNAIKYKRSLYITYLHEMRRERLVRYLFYVLLFIQNLFRIVNTNA